MGLSRRLFVCALAGAVAAGCLSPTLPMPPPAPPDIQAVGQGQYQLSGTLPQSGTALVLNRRTGIINGELASPTYRFTITAQPGDPMTLWYEVGLTSSDSRDFNIPGSKPDAGVRDAGKD